MAELKKAHTELFRRSPDECYSTLESLQAYCHDQRERSQDLWKPPNQVTVDDDLQLCCGLEGRYQLNDWSFSQLCRMAGVAKETVNRLSRPTAARVFHETLPTAHKPIQLLVDDDSLRSLHGTQYSRLWNADLLETVREAAPDFQPPQQGVTGGTGLYCGEQDMFTFLIDPGGWTEIDGENFAPGFFVWNSEVGKRSLGVQTFWFQSICQNHIVWDAVEVVEFKRKHTGDVQASLTEIARIVGDLSAKRDARRDGFATTIAKAMQERVGDTGEETEKFLTKQGINRQSIKTAVEQLSQAGRAFTLWNLVDELTRYNGTIRYAGQRTDADTKVASLLALAL